MILIPTFGKNNFIHVIFIKQMGRVIGVLFLIMFLYIKSISQENTDKILLFNKMVKNADSLNQVNLFSKAGVFYDSAYDLTKNWGFDYAPYKIAENWLYTSQKFKSLKYLKLIPKSKFYSTKDKTVFYRHLTEDSLFNVLRKNKTFSKTLKKLKVILNKFNKTYNKNLARVLDSILVKDQIDRNKIDSITNRFGQESVELKQLWAKINLSDLENISIVTGILDKYGWLGDNVVGERGSSALFAVIQHANVDLQKKYLFMLRKKNTGEGVKPWYYAYLLDRVNTRLNKKQIYGTQLFFDTLSQNYKFYPIEDEKTVNVRRYLVGLEPIEEYAKQYNIQYYFMNNNSISK